MGIRHTLSVLAIGLSLAPLSQAASVNLSPHVSNVAVGDSFSVDLLIDFSDEPTLGGGIDVIYDASLLDFVSFSFSADFEALIDPLMSCPSNNVCDPVLSAGQIENIAFGNFNGLGGIFNAGTLTFNAVNAGQASLITQANTTIGGPFVSANTWDVMAVSFTGSSVTVSEVPLPAAGWLFLAGLTSLVSARTRRH